MVGIELDPFANQTWRLRQNSIHGPGRKIRELNAASHCCHCHVWIMHQNMNICPNNCETWRTSWHFKCFWCCGYSDSMIGIFQNQSDSISTRPTKTVRIQPTYSNWNLSIFSFGLVLWFPTVPRGRGAFLHQQVAAWRCLAVLPKILANGCRANGIPGMGGADVCKKAHVQGTFKIKPLAKWLCLKMGRPIP